MKHNKNQKKEIRYIDIDSVYKNGTFIKVLSKNFDTVITGTTVHKMDKIYKDEQIYKEIERKHNISFIFVDTVSIDIKVYCVPLIDFFAFDENGYYGTINGFTDLENQSKIYYLDKDYKVFFVAENLYSFTASLQNETFEKKHIKPCDEDVVVFSSRAEAETKLPFVNI